MATPNKPGSRVDEPSSGHTTSSENSEDELIENSRIFAFNQAYDCLGLRADHLLNKGIQLAIDLQKLIVQKAAALLEVDGPIFRLGRLYYCFIHSNTSSTDITSPDEPFARPQVLHRLGQLIMDVKRNTPMSAGGWTGASLMPLVMLSQKRSSYVVVGISPLSSINTQQDIHHKYEIRLQTLTNFRQFFKYAADECKAKFCNDCKSCLYHHLLICNDLICDQRSIQVWLRFIEMMSTTF